MKKAICADTAATTLEEVVSIRMLVKTRINPYLNRDRKTQDTEMLRPIDSLRFHTKRGIIMRISSTTMFVIPT